MRVALRGLQVDGPHIELGVKEGATLVEEEETRAGS